MKSIYLLIALCFSAAGMRAQNSSSSDDIMASYIIGKWEHVSSTYPNGDVTSYKREIQFNSNGEGVCTKYTELDTLLISFEWEIKDSIVCLYVFSKQGVRIQADSQFISLLERNKFYLSDICSEENTGKVCCYRRSETEVAKY